MDYKLLIGVPATLILLIVLYNKKVDRSYILAVGVFLILLLNEIIKYSEHFYDSVGGNKELISLINRSPYISDDLDISSKEDLFKYYSHKLDILDAKLEPLYRASQEAETDKDVPTLPFKHSCSLETTDTNKVDLKKEEQVLAESGAVMSEFEKQFETMMHAPDLLV